MNLSDRAVSYLRTFVPVLYGTLIAAVLPSLPWLPADVVAWLSGDAAALAVTALAIAAWYVIWRKLEPHVPDWLTRLVLGSAQAPVYPDTAETREIIAALPEHGLSPLDHTTDGQRQSLRDLYRALDEGDPAREAIGSVLNALPRPQRRHDDA